MNRFIFLLLTSLLLIPGSLLAAQPTLEELQQQIADIVEEIEELQDRVSKPERHAATDRISWYGDLRVKADTLHYNKVTWNPGIQLDYADFGAKMAAWNAIAADAGDPRQAAVTNALTNFGAFQAGLSSEQQAVMGAGMAAAGAGQSVSPFMLAPTKKTSDINNDILYTTRLRLGMKAEIASNMDFSGRLSMYKNWGDSTGTKVFDSWNAFTMDGTDGGSTSGDFLRVERAYFNWKDIGGTPFYLSIGRRPSTSGSPANYRNNELRGGTPSGHMVDFNFDGITIGYKLEELTGIEGQAIRFCYGQGFESEWGNGEMFNDTSTANIEDTHLGGFNIDAYNDGATLVQMTLFRAQDVNDGFKGTFAFPTAYAQLFAPTMYTDMQAFKNMNFVVRYTPSTVIGDINLAGINFAREEENGFVWFGALGMTQLVPNGKAGMFGGLGTDAVFEATLTEDNSKIYMAPARAENSDTQEGYGVYVGIQAPAPMGRVGLEYNYGSEYWTPFTQAQDDAMGSKLATRGHAGEAYYIVDINKNAFIKVGGIYYDYEYTGSGSPVGKPQKIDDIKKGTAYSLMPVVDTAYDLYASMTFKF
ncbi:MAG TPA: DUF3373 family protein [Malonomonas sp.]